MKTAARIPIAFLAIVMFLCAFAVCFPKVIRNVAKKGLPKVGK